MLPKKYRKKPVVIEAFQTAVELKIETLEGTMTASPGDYVITGVKGEKYPCKPDIFEATYDEVGNVLQTEKTLDIDCIKTAKANISDIKTYGDGDTFALLCKASSKSQGWMKSTKVCNLPDGCLVQVSTQQGNNVAEALTYVPGVNMDKDMEPRKLVTLP